MKQASKRKKRQILTDEENHLMVSSEKAGELPLDQILDELTRRGELVGLTKKTIKHSHTVIKKIDAFMKEENLKHYSAEVGESFLNSLIENKKSESFIRFYRREIERFNDWYLNNLFWPLRYNLNHYSFQNNYISSVSLKFTDYMREWRVNSHSIEYVQIILKKLDIYMADNKINQYSPAVGEKFLIVIKLNIDEHNYKRVYVKTIERLNLFAQGMTPLWTPNLPQKYEFSHPDVGVCLNATIDRLSENNYSTITINNFRSVIIHLDHYMNIEGYESYSLEVGKAFLKWYDNLTTKIANHDCRAVSCINHFNDMFQGFDFCRIHKKKRKICPIDFEILYEDFLQDCRNSGIRSSTINNYSKTLIRFFEKLEDNNCHDIKSITIEMIVKVCSEHNPTDYSYIKQFLKYCARVDQTDKDFSYGVPKRKRINKLPPYYTKEERQSIEAAIDRNTSLGKRDYAIILLLIRLGLRSSDVAKLAFSELDRENKVITIIQYKTREYLKLPLLEEIEEAIDEYVVNGRPSSKETDHIFLMAYAPYYVLSAIAVHSIVSKYITKAGIDPKGRKHGGHALRASLGIDLINNGMSYDEVRKIYGHISEETIKRYSSLDITHLRLCALQAHVPTGRFKSDLESNGKI